LASIRVRCCRKSTRTGIGSVWLLGWGGRGRRSSIFISLSISPTKPLLDPVAGHSSCHIPSSIIFPSIPSREFRTTQESYSHASSFTIRSCNDQGRPLQVHAMSWHFEHYFHSYHHALLDNLRSIGYKAMRGCQPSCPAQDKGLYADRLDNDKILDSTIIQDKSRGFCPAQISTNQIPL